MARRPDHTDAIEEDLYRRQQLFGEVSIAFFDTTSGRRTDAGPARAQQGLSSAPQAAVLDGDDRRFASFLWPGNTADVTRLMPVVQRLRSVFAKAGLEYILDVRERLTKEIRNEVIEDDGVAVLPLVKTELAIKEMTLKGRRYVLCRNEEGARKDADRRGAILRRPGAQTHPWVKALVSNKASGAS